MSKTGFVSDVAAAATGHWPDLLTTMGIDTPRGGKHGPCPICGGKDRFRLDDKGAVLGFVTSAEPGMGSRWLAWL
jgi:putative DNA primase/helicase